VSGTATNKDGTENHAWNIVKSDGKCYHVDVTWDSCTRNAEGICRSCFNLTDDDIGQDHVWDKKLLPKCSSLDDNYFVRSGHFFTNGDELRRYFVDALKTGRKSFEVKLASKFADHSYITKIFQETIGTGIYPLFLGYSYQIQYDSNRGTAYILLS
jgi:hypothetical protein